MTIDEQPLLNLIQDLVFEKLWRFALEQLQAECVNRSDKHLGHAGNFTERLTSARENSLFQFGSRLLSECKCNDVRGNEGIGAAGSQQMHDASRDDFGLAGSRAGNQLKIAVSEPMARCCDFVSFIVADRD